MNRNAAEGACRFRQSFRDFLERGTPGFRWREMPKGFRRDEHGATGDESGLGRAALAAGVLTSDGLE